jgi:thiol-disulfide isomerase/thioredoxin
MNAFEIGPMVLSGERLAILLGLITFIVGAGVLAARVSDRFNPWSTAVALGGLAVARLAHVIGHWEYFSGDLLRIFAIWQGGFDWPWAVIAVIAASVLMLKERRLITWGAAPVVAGVMVWNVAYQLSSQTDPTPPPDFVLASLDGGVVALDQLDGRPTVVNLWATWCPPCRREMPALAAAQARRPDVRFLFVNQGEGPDTINAYLRANDLALEHVLLDESMAVPRHYGTVGIPVTLFLNADGRLARAHTGEIAPEQIDAEIRKLTP